MEVLNYNDIIRNFISENMLVSMDKENLEENIKELYNNISINKPIFSSYINVMYLTSYVVNYVTYLKNPDNEDAKKNVKFLRSFSSIDDFINQVDENSFELLCDDTVLFNECSYYVRKQYIKEAMSDSKFIKKMTPIFINDVFSYLKKYSSSYIVEEYYRILSEVKDKKVALEDTICFGTEFLIMLEEDDIDNYVEVFKDIINTYYSYNNYLLLNGKELDEYAIDIMDLIETNFNDLIGFSSNNGYLLEPIVRDYLTYMLLSKEDKEKIINFNNEKNKLSLSSRMIVKNPNSKIRKILCTIFGNSYQFYENDVDKYKEKLEKIKNSYMLDEIINVLYIDNMSICYYDYLSLPNDSENEENYKYLESFSSLEQFENEILQDDSMFLYFISNSIYFYCLPIIDKKEILNNLLKVNAYESYVSKNNILLDVVEFNRNYDIKDMIDLYKEAYYDSQDEKIAIAYATRYLITDLEDLQLIDEKNYNDIIYELSRLFYEYNKYLFDKENNINEENKKIIIMMENDLDNCLKEVKKDYKIREIIVNSFYNFINCNITKKEEILSYFDKLVESGKVKIFRKKNKNSN